MVTTDQVLVDRAALAAVLDPCRQPMWPSSAHARAVAHLRGALDDPAPQLQWGPLAPFIARLTLSDQTLAPHARHRLDQLQAAIRCELAEHGIDVTTPVECHRALVLLKHLATVHPMAGGSYVMAMAVARWAPIEALT